MLAKDNLCADTLEKQESAEGDGSSCGRKDTQVTEFSNALEIKERLSIEVARLSLIHIFKCIPKQDLVGIARHCRWAQYAKGQQILYQEDDSKDVYFLCSGAARATIFSSGGKEIGYETLVEGAVFGEMSAVDGLPRSTHVVSISECVIGSMQSRDFVDLLYRHPQIGIEVIKRLSGTIRSLCERVFESGTLLVNERIEAELLRIVEQSGNPGPCVRIPKPPTHAEIASRTNTHREAVTKHLNWLDRDGVIFRERRTLVIPDLEKFRARVVEASEKG